MNDGRGGGLSRPGRDDQRSGGISLRPGRSEAHQRERGCSQAFNSRFLVVVVSNQSGWPGDTSSEEGGRKGVNEAMARRLRRRGARLDAIYYCPITPRGSWIVPPGCGCRKPAPGMSGRAQEDLGFDVPRSYVVGDHRGHPAGEKRRRPVDPRGTGHGADEIENAHWGWDPTRLIVKNLAEAVDRILFER